ncbi:MAG: hypothetical protein U0670_06720 [Anaerolineae bacterium]
MSKARLICRVFLLCAVIFGISAALQAQDSPVTLSLVSETLTGTDCPFGTALQPDGAAVWVVFADCHREHYSLRQFSTSTGEPIGEPIALFDDPEHDFFRLFSPHTLVVTPEGQLRLVVNDIIAKRPVTYLIDPITGTSTRDEAVDAQVGAFINRFTPYVTGVSFSPGQTYAAAVDDTDLDVIDFANQSPLFTLPTTTTANGFSAASQFFTLDSGTLEVYRLPEGESVGAYSVPLQGLMIYPSDDGRYIAIDSDTDQLGIFDTLTGSLSNLISLTLPPFTVTDCSVRDPIADAALDLSQGSLWIRDLIWLPDGDTFLTVSEYVGDGMTQGRENGCDSTSTRLQLYHVDGE